MWQEWGSNLRPSTWGRLIHYPLASKSVITVFFVIFVRCTEILWLKAFLLDYTISHDNLVDWIFGVNKTKTHFWLSCNFGIATQKEKIVIFVGLDPKIFKMGRLVLYRLVSKIAINAFFVIFKFYSKKKTIARFSL